MNGAATIIRLKKKYATLRVVETIMASLGVAGALGAISTWIWHNAYVGIIVALATAAIIAAVRIRQLGLLSLTNERLSYFLNGMYPQLQESSELLVRPHDELSTLEEIQVRRTERALESLNNIKLPHHLAPAAIIFLGGVAAMLLSGYIDVRQPLETTLEPAAPTEVQAASPAKSDLAGASISVQPPPYTRMQPFSTQQLSASVPEGSTVTWKINFTSPPSNTLLQFSNGDSAKLSPDNGQYVWKTRIVESVIYQVKWQDGAGTHASDYYEIVMKTDGPPAVSITGLQQFTRLRWNDRDFVDVPVQLQDDFGLSSGNIIATVSKGSGESIKFREEKLPFHSPASITGKQVNARRRIDFKSLGMEPGDEIYFYAEAWDNKQPEPQRSRTETFFVSLQDTASHSIVADASLGVDLMPDYFRSQRQIIIDTEKLLRDQPTISRQAFKSTSNELGYDQKVLRLKYGQFLGEEFETTIGEPAHQEVEQADDDEKDPAKQFGHEHDKDNEHNLVPEKKPEAGHDHKDSEDESDPMAAFKHEHDKMEEATFFTVSVRAKLKAALTLMWDAELQLRLFEPKASLPIQYKILNLLKEISQDSRIYVHRMGFDPPPLKEEKRLTGDLEEIMDNESAGVGDADKPYPAIRKAIGSLNSALESKVAIPDKQLKADLEQAAVEIAQVSISMPGTYLIHLSMIRSILEGTLNESEYLPALLEIRSACWNILPYEDPGPGQLKGMHHPLDDRLLEELKTKPND